VSFQASFTRSSAAVTGNDLAPLVQAVPLVALAAVILIPAVRAAGRRVAGALMVVLAATAAVASVATAVVLTERVRRWAAGAADQDGSVVEVTTNPAWPVLAVAAFVAVVVAGVLVAVRGPRWPGMGSRYERPTSKPADGTQDRPSGGDETLASPAEAWDALDRGDDPTA
jgi:uncharacterized membrane protein (TIGR02234 family)